MFEAARPQISGEADLQEWFSIDDLAARYQSSTRHIHRLAKLGLMPAGVKLGQLRRWSRTEITAWEAAGCKPVGPA